MHTDDLYSIGDAARRSGLSVSAVRFYADAGLVEPSRVNEAGHRLYDIRAIARLELIRTLRDLDTGLVDIRKLLAGETTLHDLVVAHLELVERQERGLRARRAVLRVLVKQGGGVEQAALMHKLVSMPDEEREQLIDDFWHEVGAGLDVGPGFVDRLRAMRPRLPEDPTAAQLEAWIELADLVRDEAFRREVRAYLQEVYAFPATRQLTTEPMQEFIYETGARIAKDIADAHRAGLAPDEPRSRELAGRFARAAAEVAGQEVTPELMERMAAGFLFAEEFGQEDAAYDATHGRYVALVNAINGTPEEEPLPFTWLAAALRACVTRSGGTP